MKNKLKLLIIAFIAFLALPKLSFGQAPNLGAVADFALFSTAGAVTSSSTPIHLTHITGDIGSAPASITGFGNVDGVLYQGGTEFADASTDLVAAHAFLDGLTPTNVLATPFGGGNILTPGVHSIVNAAIWLTGEIILDAQNDPNAVFVFQLDGAFNTSANAKVTLINEAQACNVFWKVEGAVTMGAGTYMAGTVIANNDFISMAAGDTLQGRALSINGAVSVNEVLVYLPLGCGSPLPTGPPLPVLNSVECYALFSSDGPVQDNFETFAIGDVGSNLGSALGYDPLKVTGTIHPIPDASTAQCATDLGVIYNDLNALPHDIELMEPTLFGHNLVLTPHTYLMLSAVTFTDTLYLNAQGNPDAVFIFKINGAFATSTFSQVILMNGAQAENVYWKIDGAVEINDFSIFNGTFVSAGAINLFTGVVLNGRALTTVGALNTFSAEVNTPTGITDPAGTIVGSDTVCQGETGVIYSVPPINNATSYTWTLPAGTTITSGANTDSITVDFDPTAPAGTWIITVQGNSTCGSGTISPDFEVEIIESPVMDTIADQSVCANDSSSTIAFSGGSAGTTYDWTNDNTSIGLAANGSGDINPFQGINNGSNPEIATITVIPSNNGCEGDSITFQITVSNAPMVDAVLDQEICSDDSTTLVVLTGGSTGTTYDWTNDNTSIGLAANGTGDINPFQGINNGSNPEVATITVIPSNNGCAGASITFQITVSNSPQIDPVMDQEICHNEYSSTIVFSGGSTNTSYDWTNDNTSIGLAASGTGDINSFQGTNTAASPEEALVTVTASNNGCQGDSTTFNIIVTKCFDFNIPEGFSPNGDNVNDFYVVRGIEHFPNNSFVVFNRWGAKLFEASPYQNNWDGKSSIGLVVGGDELPVGTYFYVLNLGDGSDVYKGTIYLNR